MIKINFKQFYISIRKERLIRKSEKDISPDWFKFLYIIAGILSTGSWLLYYFSGLTLSYNDARSHLDVARRVVDSLTPGIAQIGSVWLPLQHLLELLTIWNDFMFRTGLSGSIISMIAFIGSVIFILKTARTLNFDRLAIVITFLIIVLNPNLLFLQSLPMTESLLLFTTLGALYFFVKWTREDGVGNLIFCGLYTFLAVLTRYDGWAILLFLSSAIPIVAYLRSSKRKAEGSFFIFATFGFFAVFLWLMWNLLIFKDPLFFMDSKYSAKAQQDILLERGLLLTKYDLIYSIKVYFLSIVSNSGMTLSILGLTGILISLFSGIRTSTKIIFIGFLIPILFNVASLYLGQSVIHLPQLPPFTWFNIRYGIMALPAIAIGTGYLVNKRALASLLVALIIVFQYGTMYITNNIITVQDGVRGSSGDFLDDIGQWVNKNASDGLILIPASSHDALIFISGLPLNRFITEGTGKYWRTSLKDPTKYAKYVIMHEGDLVYKELHGNPKFLKNYYLIYKGEFSNVYKRNF